MLLLFATLNNSEECFTSKSTAYLSVSWFILIYISQYFVFINRSLEVLRLETLKIIYQNGLLTHYDKCFLIKLLSAITFF